jgi:hypothetical protein
MSTSLSAEGRQRRARAAALSRHHPEQAGEDRRVLKRDAMERYIREMVDRWAAAQPRAAKPLGAAAEGRRGLVNGEGRPAGRPTHRSDTANDTHAQVNG